MASPEQALKSGLASALQNGDFSDFTITCGARSFKVHKVIISAQSEYFRAACRNFKEAEKNAIELATSDADPTCDDPEAIRCMVDFFYHLEYQSENFMTPSTSAQAAIDLVPSKRRKAGSKKHMVPPPSKLEPQQDENMLVHACVFAAAVKYQIPALVELAVTKFAAAVEINRSHDSFAKTIQAVYTTTAPWVRQLRDIVADTINEHDELLDSEDIAETICGLDGLSWEFFRKSKGLSAVPDAKKSSTALTCGCIPTWSTEAVCTGHCKRKLRPAIRYCEGCGDFSEGSLYCFNCSVR